MDNVTHTLVGAALGAAGLRRMSRLAGPALLIGANLPDVDAFVYVFDSTVALAVRRGWTHGILALVVWPFVLAGLLIGCDALAARVRRRDNHEPVPWRPLLLVCAIAVWSHPLLDWLNTYGVRLLMPFSGRWFYGDALFIFDPWVMALLGVGLFFSRKRGAQPARAALILMLLYVAGMWTLSALTRGVAERGAIRDDLQPVRVIASPVPLNSFARGTAVETRTAYHFGRVSWLPPRTVLSNETQVDKNLELIERVRVRDDVRAFMVWSRAPFAVLTQYAIEIGDARYAGPTGEWARLSVPIPAGEIVR
jgi:inner membrane protein